MAENSNIEWTDHTFNPWRGCTKVSEGCAHCYAETLSKRNPALLGQWGPGKPRVKASAAMWKEPLKWNTAAARQQHEAAVIHGNGLGCRPDLARRPRVFCASLADWLDDEVPIEWLAELLDLIMRTPNLDWLLLTKRPQNWRHRMDAIAMQCPNASEDLLDLLEGWTDCIDMPERGGWPDNIWIGTTVENQARAAERIPQLLSIPAKLRFLSCEPLLEEVGLFDTETGWPFFDSRGMPSIHWVICGGESGTDARPMHPDWARSLRDQCSDAGVPFFFKQWGEWLPGCQYREGDLNRFKEKAQHSFSLDDHSWWVGKKNAGRELDGRTHDEFPKVERGTGA